MNKGNVTQMDAWTDESIVSIRTVGDSKIRYFQFHNSLQSHYFGDTVLEPTLPFAADSNDDDSISLPV